MSKRPIEYGRDHGEYATRGQAIYKKCLDCAAYHPGEVEKCPATACWLWPWRNPKAARTTNKALGIRLKTPEQRDEARQRSVFTRGGGSTVPGAASSAPSRDNTQGRG